MSLLHHREHAVPFEDQPDRVEADLRAQIARLHTEKRDLCSLIEEQRVELARAERHNHDLRRRLTHAERQLQKLGPVRRWLR